MFKCNKLLGVSLAAIMSISAAATNVFAIDTSVIDENGVNQPLYMVVV